MEESDRIETGIDKRPETYKRKMMMVYALAGFLVLAGVGALVYFFNSSSSKNGSSSVSTEELIEPKDYLFFEKDGIKVGSVEIIRLNDDGQFSERITLEFPPEISKYKAYPEISQSTETICMAVDRGSDFQVYTADLKTKDFKNVFSAPYNSSKDGKPKFHFSPDCGSFAYFFSKKDQGDGRNYEEKSKVVLKNLKKTSDNYEFECEIGKRAFLILGNGGRFICNFPTDLTREVWLFSKENEYKGKKLFEIERDDISDNISHFKASEDANLIFYAVTLKDCYLAFRIMLFEVSSGTQKFIEERVDEFLISSNGGRIATSKKTDNDNNIKVQILDVETRKLVKEIEVKGLHDFDSWSTNGKFLFFDFSNLSKLSISDGSFEPVKDKDGKNL